MQEINRNMARETTKTRRVEEAAMLTWTTQDAPRECSWSAAVLVLFLFKAFNQRNVLHSPCAG